MSGNVNGWYASLASQGLFLSDVILNERLPEGPSSVGPAQFNEVKSALLAFRTAVQDEESEASTEDVLALMEALFVDVLGHRANEFQAANSDGTNISAKFKASMPGKSLVPDFVLRRHGNTNRGRLLAKTLPPSVKLRGASRAGKAQRELILLLRHCRLEFGLLTNGHSLRLLRVTPEDVSWIQWDTATWEESEQGRSQFDAFYTLLGRDEIGQQPLDASKAESTDGPDRYVLQDACLQSRQRQSSLSSVVGEGVRQSVELLVNRLNEAAISSPELLEDILGDALPRSDEERSALSSLHQAAVRLVMRMIVIMFAEARDLLPHRSSQVYRNNYSLTRLLEQLEDTESSLGQEALTTSLQAWQRILGLFDLVHDGSHHESLSIHAYGGELFRPGVGDSDDAVLRSLHAFEHEKATLDDARVLSILRKLKRSKMKANINGKSTWVATTVDYTTMDTEFIGMVYEGLLDYELRRVHEDDGAMVTLRIGQQPMLPISLLESQDDVQLKSLIKTLDKNKDAGAPDLEEETKASDDSSEEDEPTEDEVAENAHDIARERAEVWALRAVKASGKVKKPKGKKAQFVDMKELEIEAARNLLLSIHAPGDMYLVNYSGNRKGSGTFYTPPGLSIPTVRRTLEPLCYDIVEEESEEGLVRTLTPKTPEHILAQTVCDPAMGSGSFLVAALRYLTDALFTSLEYHGNFNEMKKGTRITLPAGTVSKAAATEDLALHPDDARFEVECKARLKRYVAQRCIYGVDLNPMAVELGKMSLWVETLSRDLPFEFLDHHIKCGNSLVGTWFDEFEHFPLAAFARDTGDSGKKHAAPVHHQPNTWRDLMREHFNELKDPNSSISVTEMIVAVSGQKSLFNFSQVDSLDERRKLLQKRREGFLELQQLPLHDPVIREQRYRELQEEDEFQSLKLLMDTWTACWFWPANQLRFAPTPTQFGEVSNSRTIEIVQNISNRFRFFHWELEFPDVFWGENPGFSAKIGNPAWETMKPNSIEFFQRYDALWNTYGVQVATKQMKSLFEENEEIEDAWVKNLDMFAAYSSFFRNRNNPFGDPKRVKDAKGIKISKGNLSDKLHDDWRRVREKSICVMPHSNFSLQGKGDINLYKLFLEQSHQLLQNGGELGIIVPAGIYGDDGAKDLRRQFIEKNEWRWIFAFENRNKIFDIHRSFKFAVVLLKKGGNTSSIKVAFMTREVSEWEIPNPIHADYNVSVTTRLAPNSFVFVEIPSQSALVLLEKIVDNTIPLGNQGNDAWSIVYQCDFHMAGDADKFRKVTEFEAEGFVQTKIGVWQHPDGRCALPLYQGTMINIIESNRARWISGTGQSAKWEKDLARGSDFYPQYLIPVNEVATHRSNIIDSRFSSNPPGQVNNNSSQRILVRRLGRSTDRRTAISSPVPPFPSGDSVASFFTSKGLLGKYGLASILSSFTFDWSWRQRVVGANQSWSFYSESRVLSPSKTPKQLILLALRLSATHPAMASDWLAARDEFKLDRFSINEWLATSPNDGLRIQAMIDAIVALSHGLSRTDLAEIMRDCDLPSSVYNSISGELDPKGFWRNGKEVPLCNRPTMLTLLAFDQLLDIAIETDSLTSAIEQFVGNTPTSGWQLPAQITVEDILKASAGLLGNHEYEETDLQLQSEDTVTNPYQTAFPDNWVEVETLAKQLDQALAVKRTSGGYFS